MLRAVKAKVLHGKIELLEDIDLAEGQEVTVLLREEGAQTEEEATAAFERAAGGWEGTLDFEEFLEDLRKSRKAQIPPIDLDS
jgi:hypothetical protein